MDTKEKLTIIGLILLIIYLVLAILAIPYNFLCLLPLIFMLGYIIAFLILVGIVLLFYKLYIEYKKRKNKRRIVVVE